MDFDQAKIKKKIYVIIHISGCMLTKCKKILIPPYTLG